MCSVLHPNLNWLLLTPSDVYKGRTTLANMASSKQMLWTRSSVVFPHPVRTPDSNLQNNKLKLSCHMYRCSAFFRIGWASSLCLNKPQIKLNNNLICLRSMANFENAELDYKEKKKTNHNNNNKMLKKSMWEIKTNPWQRKYIVFKLFDLVNVLILKPTSSTLLVKRSPCKKNQTKV